jgi:hypothetical protein
LGATGVGDEITGVPPTLSEAIVVLPLDPAQVVVDDDCAAPRSTVGTMARPRCVEATDAEAVDVGGPRVVVTLAHRTWADMALAALTLATHGVVVDEADVVATWPVSGIGETDTNPSREMPNARPVMIWAKTVTVSDPHAEGAGLLLVSPV